MPDTHEDTHEDVDRMTPDPYLSVERSQTYKGAHASASFINAASCALHKAACDHLKKLGAYVDEVDIPDTNHEPTYFITYPRFGIVFAHCTLVGVQDLIVRSYPLRVDTQADRNKYFTFLRIHGKLAYYVERYPPFAIQRARIQYIPQHGLVRDARIPWEYLNALDQAERTVAYKRAPRTRTSQRDKKMLGN